MQIVLLLSVVIPWSNMFSNARMIIRTCVNIMETVEIGDISEHVMKPWTCLHPQKTLLPCAVMKYAVYFCDWSLMLFWNRKKIIDVRDDHTKVFLAYLTFRLKSLCISQINGSVIFHMKLGGKVSSWWISKDTAPHVGSGGNSWFCKGSVVEVPNEKWAEKNREADFCPHIFFIMGASSWWLRKGKCVSTQWKI